MKKVSYVLFLFSFFVFIVSLAGLFFNSRPIQMERIYTSVNVTSDFLGFDLNGTALTFGRVLKGGNSVRNINFQNGYPFPVVVKTKVDGEMTNLLNFDGKVKVGEGESRKLSFNLNLDDADEGLYDGFVEIVVVRDVT